MSRQSVPSENRFSRIRFFLFLLLLNLLILACNLPGREKTDGAPGLNLNPRSKDGTVSGTYAYTHDGTEVSLSFEASPDGKAAFRHSGSTGSDQLVVDISDEVSGGMQWSGISLDGFGELSPSERTALEDLGSDLLTGISLIPLELGCLGEEAIDPHQLAALLFPLQMHYKYQVADRSAYTMELLSLSTCDYSRQLEEPSAGGSAIYLSPANPIPVVIGYFPFDADGAAESPLSSLCGPGFAQLIPPSVGGSAELAQVSSLANDPPPVIRDQLGPCEARCRGACGPDCTLNNCRLSADYRCEVDDAGNNTGEISYLHIYDCGLHPACIKHDACYDECNRRYGCGTFRAAHCRHGGWNSGVNIPDDHYCDLHTVREESLSAVRGWVDGYGPQPVRQVFVYTDPGLGSVVDLENCPVDTEDPPAEISEAGPDSEPPGDYFVGDVISAYSGTAPVFDITGSIVEIEVIDGMMSVAIEYTQYSTLREGEGLCNVIFTTTMAGTAPYAASVTVDMEVVSRDIEAFEGQVCEAGYGWATSAEEDMLAGFERNVSVLLTGEFTGDIFEGTLSPMPLRVLALRVD